MILRDEGIRGMKKYAEAVLVLALLVLLYRGNERTPVYIRPGQYDIDYCKEARRLRGELQNSREKLLLCQLYRDFYKSRMEKKEQMLEAGNSLERIYLIRYPSELEEVCRLVRNGEAIDRGVPAGFASYQLAADIEASDWMVLGSGDMPFHGSLDGCGHCITGAFAVKGEDSFITADSLAVIRDVKVKNTATEESIIQISLGSAADIKEYCKVLDQSLCGGLRIILRGLDVGTGPLEALMKAIWKLWEKDGERDGFFISLSVEEYPQEEMKRQEQDLQYLSIPIADEQNKWADLPYDFELMAEDINFDGRKDLLLRLGTNHKTGRKREHYIGIVWNGATKSFSFMDSFPEFVSFLEWDRQRIVEFWCSDKEDRYLVYLYEFMDGQYEETKRLELIRDNSQEDKSVIIKTYHGGDLIDSCDFSDGWEKEFSARYSEWTAYVGNYEGGWFSVGW